jgi:hypothetical protein
MSYDKPELRVGTGFGQNNEMKQFIQGLVETGILEKREG